jgi:dihydrofolate synthase/folylpolyglutamate synthase
LDHQEYLGETLAEIAGEKAAIIRPGVTAIIAPQPPQALDVILQRSAECRVATAVGDWQVEIEGATDDGRFTVTFETPEGRYKHVRLGLRGRHQIINVALAIRIAESLRTQGFDISHHAIVTGIELAAHAGRLEWISGFPSLLLDGAHNPSGAQALRGFLDEFVRAPLTLVFGAMKDKKLDEIAVLLFPVAWHLILTEPDNPRAARIDDLQRLAEGIVDPQSVIAGGSVSAAIGLAMKVTPPDGVILVSGSLYLVGEVRGLTNFSSLSTVVH